MATSGRGGDVSMRSGFTEDLHETKDSTLDNGKDLDSEYPLIFRCSCGVIVGDSVAWVTANDVLGTATLTRVTKQVHCGKTLVSSSSGEDIGSAYLVLKCEGCKKDIGKMYKTTPRRLDDLRDRFTLTVDKIESYQVGSSEQVAPGLSMMATDGNLSVPRSHAVFAELKQLQTAVAALNDRLSAVEDAFRPMKKTEEKDFCCQQPPKPSASGDATVPIDFASNNNGINSAQVQQAVVDNGKLNANLNSQKRKNLTPASVYAAGCCSQTPKRGKQN